MNWRRYSDKIPIYVSAGVLITGSFWFLREDDHIRGEDVAELRAAVLERTVAFMDGPVLLSTNHPVTVVEIKKYEDTSGACIVWQKGDRTALTTVEFAVTNWSKYVTDSFVCALPGAVKGDYAEFGFLVDGERSPGRVRVMVGRPPPEGGVAGGDFGQVDLPQTRIELSEAGNRVQTVFRLKREPRPLIVSGGPPERVDSTAVAERGSSFAALARCLRGVLQKSQDLEQAGRKVWWIDAQEDFDVRYASSAGGLLLVGDPGYEVTGTATVSETAGEFTNAVLWEAGGTNAVVTPLLFTLNSVVLQGTSLPVFTNGAFGWSPDLGSGALELVPPDGCGYMFLPSLARLPGYATAVTGGRPRATGATEVVVSEFPWSPAGWWNQHIGGDALWALPVFDSVEDGTNPVESLLQDKVLGDEVGPAGYAARTAAGAMSRSMTVEALFPILPDGGSITNAAAGAYAPGLVGEAPTVVSNRYWYAYRAWNPFGYEFETNEYSATSVTGVLNYADNLPFSLLSVDARGQTIETTYAKWDGDQDVYCWWEEPLGEEGHWESVSFPVVPDESDEPRTGGSYTHDVAATYVYGAAVGYPSEFALTAGLVARVRVYAVYELFRANVLPSGPYADFASTNEYEYTVPSGFPDPDGLKEFITDDGIFLSTATRTAENSGYSFLSAASTFEYLSGVVGGDADGIVLQDYWDPSGQLVMDESKGRLDMFKGSVPTSRAFKTLRLSKIADLENPTNYPVRVSFGIRGPEGEGSLPEFGFETESAYVDKYADSGFLVHHEPNSTVFPGWSVYRLWFTSGYDHVLSSGEHKDSGLGRELVMSPEVIVVVDWNFSHLAETPYEPDPYTPEWLSTNSP